MGPPSPNSAPMGFLDTPAFDSGNMANFSQTNPNQQFEFNISSPTALSSNQVPVFLQPKQVSNLFKEYFLKNEVTQIIFNISIGTWINRRTF